MRYMKEILKKNRGMVIFFIAIGIFNSFTANFKASFYQKVIDGLTERSVGLSLIIIYGVILIIHFLMNYIDNYPDRKLAHGIFLDFKLMALKKIQRIDYSAYQKLGTGTLTQQIENGAQAGTDMIYDFWLRLIRELIPTILFSILFIWKIHPPLIYALLGGYVFVFIITNLLLKFLYRIKERILSNEEKLNHYLVRGIMEMVLFRVERRFNSEILKASKAKDEVVNAKTRMTIIHEAFFTIFALLVAVLDVGILIYAWYNRSLSIGSVVALIALIDNAYTPIAIFNVLYVQYKLNRPAYKRFEEFMDSEDDSQMLSGEPVNHVEGCISIQGLHFRYGEREIIRNLQLDIQKGEKVAFVGESGSGKSTLVKILAGLVKYKQGSVQIDGMEVKELCLEDLYAHISYISQDSPVYDGTLRENLAFDEAVTDAELEEALSKTQLETLYAAMPMGLDTALGERGMILSGGEKQRVALARLWIERRPLTILDEATSAMDNLTEEAVMDELMQLLSENTVIAIAHRLHSVQNFDRIVVFKQGQIVGEGTFEELLKNNAYFAELYKASVEQDA